MLLALSFLSLLISCVLSGSEAAALKKGLHQPVQSLPGLLAAGDPAAQQASAAAACSDAPWAGWVGFSCSVHEHA